MRPCTSALLPVWVIYRKKPACFARDNRGQSAGHVELNKTQRGGEAGNWPRCWKNSACTRSQQLGRRAAAKKALEIARPYLDPVHSLTNPAGWTHLSFGQKAEIKGWPPRALCPITDHNVRETLDICHQPMSYMKDTSSPTARRQVYWRTIPCKMFILQQRLNLNIVNAIVV